MKKKIALVVPGLKQGGGVPTVASFYLNFFRNELNCDVKVISLSMSSFDADSKRLLKPTTWFTKPTVSKFKWLSNDVFHVGSNFAEIEFFRYTSRNVLNNLFEDCDFIQLICGVPIWIRPIKNVNKPISVQFATTIKSTQNGGLPTLVKRLKVLFTLLKIFKKVHMEKKCGQEML